MDESNFPSGILTFLFTDIQGSTPLWEKDPSGMSEALELHNFALHTAIKLYDGLVFKIIGDEFQAVFVEPLPAIQAAVGAQRALKHITWGRVGPLRVRMGIHTGPAEWEGLDYAVSHTFNRTARIMSTGHGGQIIISGETVEQLGDRLPQEMTLQDMGRHRLKGLTLREHLFQINTADLSLEFPPLKTIAAGLQESGPGSHHNLPLPATPFVGRQQELAELGELFAAPDTRLVTIVGPGGMGKTRMGLEFAWRRRGQYASGVCFISLAPLTAPEQILPAVASNTGLHFKGDREPRQQLLRYLKKRQMLLIFDNFEHLCEGAGLLKAIVEFAPQVDVLATSRERLGLAEECLYEVAGLALPQDDESCKQLAAVDAVRMFVTYARRVRPSYEMGDQDRTAVSDLCCLVGGMPLAIELASAWIRALSPTEILAEMREDLRLLERQSPGVPPRQLSMQASFDYSWRLLNEEERAVLMRLSVFRGGISRRSAQEVTGATIHTLGRLVDKSMLRREPESGRYQMHELLRQLAEARLQARGLAETTMRDHADHFLVIVTEAKGKAISEEGMAEFAQLIKLELDNCRAAMKRSLEGGNAAITLHLALMLVRENQFLWREQVQWFEEALQVGENQLPSALEARVQLDIARIMLQEDIRTRGRGHWIDVATRAMALYEEIGDERGTARALHTLGFAYFGNDFELSNAYYVQAIAAYEKLGEDPIGSLLQRAWIHTLEGYFAEAQEINGQVMTIAQKNGDELLKMVVKTRLAQIAFYEGDLEAAQSQTEDALNFRSSQGRSASIHTRNLAMLIQLDVALSRQDLDNSRRLIHEWLCYIQEEDHYTLGMFLFHKIALWLQLLGKHRQVAFWIGASECVRDGETQPLEKVEQPVYQKMKTAVRVALGEACYASAYQEGYNTPRDEIIDLAFSLLEVAK